MNYTIPIILLTFGLVTLFLGAFYKLFLHDKSRKNYFFGIREQVNLSNDLYKKPSWKKMLNLASFGYTLGINREVWIGLIYIIILSTVLLVTLVVLYFAPESFSYAFAIKVGEFLKLITGR